MRQPTASALESLRLILSPPHAPHASDAEDSATSAAPAPTGRAAGSDTLRAMKPTTVLVPLLLLATAPSFAATAKTAAKPAVVTKKAVPFQADYAKALAEARARKVPLFIEAWAPW